jgi:NADH-quinone oxidoreductase subunit J
MIGSETYREILFWAFALIAVAPGLGILLSRDIVRQAFWLLASLAGFAGLYLHLGADFLGFTQVVVYIGGILILFLFGVMLTHKLDVPLKSVKNWSLVLPGTLAGALIAAALLHMVFRTSWEPKAKSPDLPTTAGIGERIMSSYLLPFEVVSVVLLVAMVGATYIARRGGGAGGGEGGEE